MQNETNELATLLEFTTVRAKSGQMSLEEVKSWLDVLLEHSTLWATVEELADFREDWDGMDERRGRDSMGRFR